MIDVILLKIYNNSKLKYDILHTLYRGYTPLLYCMVSKNKIISIQCFEYLLKQIIKNDINEIKYLMTINENDGCTILHYICKDSRMNVQLILQYFNDFKQIKIIKY